MELQGSQQMSKPSSQSSPMLAHHVVVCSTCTDAKGFVCSAIVSWVVEVSAWECPLCLPGALCQLQRVNATRTLKNNSPYPPRPMFIATSSSLMIMYALRLPKGQRTSQELHAFMKTGCDEERADSRRCPCSETKDEWIGSPRRTNRRIGN